MAAITSSSPLTFIVVLKKIALFFKNYGILILLAIGLVFALFFAKNKMDAYNQIVKQMQDQINQHNQEVGALEASHQQEIAQYQAIENRYETTLTQIQAQYDQAEKQLSAQQTQQLHTLVQQYNNDPVKMVSAIQSAFGITIFVSGSN